MPFAFRGYDVLFVDMDPQTDASQFLLAEKLEDNLTRFNEKVKELKHAMQSPHPCVSNFADNTPSKRRRPSSLALRHCVGQLQVNEQPSRARIQRERLLQVQPRPILRHAVQQIQGHHERAMARGHELPPKPRGEKVQGRPRRLY